MGMGVVCGATPLIVDCLRFAPAIPDWVMLNTELRRHCCAFSFLFLRICFPTGSGATLRNKNAPD